MPDLAYAEVSIIGCVCFCINVGFFLLEPRHITYVFGVEKSHQSSGGISLCIWASLHTCHFTSCCCFVFHVYIYANMLWGSFAHEHALHHAYLLLESSSCHDMFYFELNKLANILSWICFCHDFKFYQVWNLFMLFAMFALMLSSFL